jgi:hypothetical protein
MFSRKEFAFSWSYFLKIKNIVRPVGGYFYAGGRLVLRI